MIREIIRNVTSNWAGLFLGVVIAFFLSPFLVHRLGDVNYGLWVLILSVTGYMGLLDIGLRVSIVKYVSRLHAVSDSEGLNKTVSTGVAMYGLIALIIIIVSIILQFIIDKIFPIPQEAIFSARIVTLLAGANLALTLVLSVFGGFLSGLQRYDIVNMIGIPVLILRSIAIVIFISQGFSIITLGIIHLLSQVLSGGLMIRECYKKWNPLRIHRKYVNLESVRSLFSYSVFILMNSVAMMLLFKSGEIVTGIVISTAAVTYYAIASGLTHYLSQIIGTMTQVLHPYASAKDAGGDVESIKTAVLVGTKVCLLITLPIGITFVILGEQFIASWMGESYATVAGPLLVILAITRIFWLAQSATGNIMLGVGKHKVLVIINLITAVASIIGSLILVFPYGLLGLVIGSAIPVIFIQGLIMPLYACRIFEFSILEYLRESWLGPVFSTIFYASILIIIEQTHLPETLPGIFVSVLIAMPVYLGISYFASFKKIERQKFLNAFKSFLPLNSKKSYE